MSPRKRTRFTRQKKSRKMGGDPDAPSNDEWATMTPYGSFIVRDDEEEDNVFRVGDHAIIIPEGHKGNVVEEHTHWVAKIKEIRARADSTDVWARVQWYWSGEDVSALIKSFDGSSCARYERIFSDTSDFVSSFCFNGVVTMKKYREDDLDQANIDSVDFFCRHTLEYPIRKVDPKPTITCICQSPYNPDDDLIMHFCPRPGCRKAYHRQCLLEAGHTEPDSPDRDLRLLACSPDTDSDPPTTADPPQKKRGRGRPPKHGDSFMATLANLISTVPPELVELAQQPIIKGGKDGTVVGNVKSVVRARRMIYDVIGGTAPLPSDWKTLVDTKTTSAARRRTRKEAIPPLVCPECKSPI